MNKKCKEKRSVESPRRAGREFEQNKKQKSSSARGRTLRYLSDGLRTITHCTRDSETQKALPIHFWLAPARLASLRIQPHPCKCGSRRCVALRCVAFRAQPQPGTRGRCLQPSRSHRPISLHANRHCTVCKHKYKYIQYTIYIPTLLCVYTAFIVSSAMRDLRVGICATHSPRETKKPGLRAANHVRAVGIEFPAYHPRPTRRMYEN